MTLARFRLALVGEPPGSLTLLPLRREPETGS